MSIHVAKENFLLNVLPRRKWDESLKTHRLVLPNENDRGELYPLWNDIILSTAQFGLGIGVYFTQLVILFVVMLLLALLLTPFLISYRGKGDNGWPAAVCNSIIVNATINCPNNAISCTASYRSNCNLTYTDIITDLAMCILLLFVPLVIWYIENKVIKNLDECIQTAQDYSIKVDNPNDVCDDADEWAAYFSRFGKVRYITLLRQNRSLILLLQRKLELIEAITALSMQSNDYNKLNTTYTTTAANTDISHTNTTVHTLYHNLKQLTPLFWSLDDYIYALNEINIQLDEAYKMCKYPINHVYVSFEWEETQMLALDTLTAAGKTHYRDIECIHIVYTIACILWRIKCVRYMG